MRRLSLKAFLIGNSDSTLNTPGCSNYDRYYGGCLLREDCLVESGHRCFYFEKAVLPIAGQIGLANQISDLYSKNTGLIIRIKNKARYCECGEILPPRKRFCDKCQKQRRREHYRKMKQNQRDKMSTS